MIKFIPVVIISVHVIFQGVWNANKELHCVIIL